MTIEPLVIEFEVGVPPAQAFETWTRRCATWWPPSHTVSRAPAAITFEPRAGGPIVERASDGTEHRWGTVLDWEPPVRLRYLWHLFFEESEATEVAVTFTPREAGTAVRLEQTGWERLGDVGPPRRDRTRQVWAAITARFTAAC
ncbi:MAG: SRPBCC domain-containing protein [Solirubrobacterales bacterium]|nr:SRPBCC domain-containing protein [Solirubrobacterales bacterium]